MKTVGLLSVQAYNEWEDGEAGMDLAKDVLPVSLTRMTEEQSDILSSCDWVIDVKALCGPVVLKLLPE